ncbi:MAG TPA: elongation factor P [Candidatus Desulfofervidus auxilii]|uniref:Elongation factor P n=1 Tax=Desulfofervidus auxilii TaxID=1621989 RepID=A0A7C0Y8M5_DESA2|nr:elongation factor P [Candidatus Desulfofervidus auxilii]
MYTTSDIRRGLKIEFKGEPYEIIEFLHVKPGKGQAFVRTKLKNLITGAVIEHNFRTSDRIPRPNLEEKEMQFLYREDEHFCFMDLETYDQIFMEADRLGEQKKFLKENLVVKILFFNEKPVAIELPTTVDLEVIETDPGVRGDTATGGSKPAKLETGAVVQVPLFINEGDIIRIDTRTGEYIERISSK